MINSTSTQHSIQFSVIIPVLHEEKSITTCIDQLKTMDSDASFEIIVVDGDPSGSTINIISDTIIQKIVSDPNRGKQMNKGADYARGDILVFLHVDTVLPKNAFILIQNVLQQQKYVGGAFSLRFDSEKKSLKLIANYSTFRSYITRLPYGDQVIFLRKEIFEELGGYAPIPLMEDIEFMKRIRKGKHKIKILSEKVTTSSRRLETEGILYSMIRNLVIITLYHCGVSAYRLKKIYPDIPG
jgi:rSAM/selenodomain-associated transferase 2